jgi:hypothetical protein
MAPEKQTLNILIIRADIHQALLSQFSLLAEFYIEKVQVKERDGTVLKLVNLHSE